MKNSRLGLRTWIEIDRKKIAHNYKIFRSVISKKTRLMAVVKSNAYGHSLVDFAKEMESLGADWLGVDSVVEGLALRKEGVSLPILVLGYTLPERAEEAVEKEVSLTVSSFEQLEAVSKLRTAKVPKVHIKVDTGMHRQGFLIEDISRVVSLLKKNSKRIKVEGLFTHFASAKNPSFPEYTKRQIGEFEAWRKAFRAAGFSFISHAAATAGTLLFPESHFDMVRIGIGLYGLWPAKEVEAHFRGKITLEPIMTWKSVIGEVKRVSKGSKIGYDLAETLQKDSTIAICPIGYWHGFPRALSSIGRVLIGGLEARVLGRVSMDMITIDISAVPKANPGDEVVIIGHSGKSAVTAGEIANLSDTSHYEIVTRVNPLIKRFFI